MVEGLIKDDTPRRQRKCQSKEKRPKWTRQLYFLATNDVEGLITLECLEDMRVVVCVTIYCSNGMLEGNTKSIGRTEGVDLSHFS